MAHVGADPLDRMAHVGADPLDRMAHVGADPLDRMAHVGADPLDRMAHVGADPLDRMAHVGADPLDRMAHVGADPLDRMAHVSADPLDRMAHVGADPLDRMAHVGADPLDRMAHVSADPLDRMAHVGADPLDRMAHVSADPLDRMAHVGADPLDRMAHVGADPLDSEQLCCPVCLDLLKEPVAIPCGHSYCMGCISDCWAGDDPSQTFSCPQCRQRFSPKPALNRNTILAHMVEKLKKTGGVRSTTTPSPPHHGYAAGPGDVACDFCPGGATKAVRSCLVCLASYCGAHLGPHSETPALRKHTLVEATMTLQERVCAHHDKLLEIYCRSDQQCVCLLCVMDDHRGHDTVPAAAERNDRQRQLGRSRRRSRQRVQVKEKELVELRKLLQTLQLSAQTAVEDSERIFTELIRSMERRRVEVRELIRAQEQTAVSQTAELLELLEEEVARLRRRDAELERLSTTEDHVYFLQNCQSVFQKDELTESPGLTVALPLLDFRKVRSSVCALQKKLEELFKGELPKISRAANTVKLIQWQEPRVRPEFLYYSYQLTVDPKTAHRDLSVSLESRAVTVRTRDHSCPDHPERFDYWCQALCHQALSGRCYWETEWSGGGLNVAVAYRSAARKGDGNDAHFGRNGESWSLFCSGKGCTFWHGNVATRVATPAAAKIGVYLDHRAGTLCFYSVSNDTMTLLHRVQTRFRELLYPGFEFTCYGVSLVLCQVE